MRSSIKTPRMMFAGLAVTALLAAPALAACSSTDANTTTTAASAAATPVAKIDALTGQSTAVKLDAGFLKALTTLKLAPGTVGTAKLTAGSLIFPITGGNVTYYTPGSVTPYVTGDIKHNGSGFSLTAGTTKVELTNFEINPGTSELMGDVSVNGTSAAKGAILFDLDGNTLKPLQTGANNTAILEGTRVLISADAAGLLNKTFKTDAVKPGTLVGIAKITVNTK
jgi:maltose-binding protein MalE